MAITDCRLIMSCLWCLILVVVIAQRCEGRRQFQWQLHKIRGQRHWQSESQINGTQSTGHRQQQLGISGSGIGDTGTQHEITHHNGFNEEEGQAIISV